MIKRAHVLALMAGASLLALSGTARAADAADDVTIETPSVDTVDPVDSGIVDEPKYVVDPVVDDSGIADSGVLEEPVDITRAGDDGGRPSGRVRVQAHHGTDVHARGAEQLVAVLLGPRQGPLVRQDAGAGPERFQAQAREEAARRPLNRGAGDRVGLQIGRAHV